MAAMLWLTRRTVRPPRATSSILSRHLRWKCRSPTASTSSTIRISGLEVGGDREGQPHVHPAGVALHRRVEELLDLGEGDDLVELAVDLTAGHPQDGAVEVDVLAARQFGVEARADLQQAADPSAQLHPAGRRLGDPREDLQQRRLPGAVAADDADDLARPNVEARPPAGPRTPRIARSSAWPRSTRSGAFPSRMRSSRRVR